MTRIYRSHTEPLRDQPTFEQRWKDEDKGLITCWEVGRTLAVREPELAERAKRGELPPAGWKGGVENATKSGEKIGTLYYLAQWLGLRGEDLDIDTADEPVLVCSRTGMKVTFTGDPAKYANA